VVWKERMHVSCISTVLLEGVGWGGLELVRHSDDMWWDKKVETV
jgi:hypothetical protein